MDYGLHLPLIGFTENQFTLDWLRAYAQAAQRLGYAALSVNDHLIYSRAWLDGLVALSAALPDSRSLGLFTTVALPVLRGPLALARTLEALDVLSGGRLVVAVGPGSSPRDFAAVGVPFEERWKRLDDAVPAMAIPCMAIPCCERNILSQRYCAAVSSVARNLGRAVFVAGH